MDGQAVFRKRSAKARSSVRRRAATPPDAASDFTSSDDEQGHRIKRRRTIAGVGASSRAAPDRPAADDEHAAGTARKPPVPATDNATKQSNWHDEELDEKSLLGTTRALPPPGEVARADGSYRGASSYQTFIQKNPNAPTRQVGPIKAATNIRTITVTDFAPDVCKDYKQTGFCGFGDSCKYLHAREDYKAGWELDRDWEIQTKGTKLAGRTVASRGAGQEDGADDDDDDDDEVLESVPFACIICKQPYTSPIVTRCGHYFCEACALKRYRKNPSCAACNAPTGGVFNVAKKLARLLDRKRERAKRRREQAIQAGEDVSDDEDE